MRTIIKAAAAAAAVKESEVIAAGCNGNALQPGSGPYHSPLQQQQLGLMNGRTYVRGL